MSKTLFGNLTYWKFHVFNKISDVTWHAPVPGRDHARHILQKMTIHEIHFEMVKIQIRNSVLFEMIKIQIGNRPQSRSRPGSRQWQGPVPYSDFDHFWDVKRVCVRICMFSVNVRYFALLSCSFCPLFALFSRSCRALAAFFPRSFHAFFCVWNAIFVVLSCYSVQYFVVIFSRCSRFFCFLVLFSCSIYF